MSDSRGRIMLAAPMSGSGKTTVTCGILGALSSRGIRVASYKCGPDYIDPMFHREVLGIPSENLDAWFCSPEQLREILARGKADLKVIEGVMGIYDGLGGISQRASSYEVAEETATPVILVMNARGMGRTALSLLRGILDDDTSHLIRGLILNEISAGWYPTMKHMIEKNLPIEVLGYVPKRPDLVVASRHLGLMTPESLADVKEILGRAAEQIRATVDLDRVLAIAGEAEELPDICHWNLPAQDPVNPVRIACARDEAFCFLYEENERILREQGATLIPFSPIHDSHLPENIDGLILCGGYPELYLKELSSNETMLKDIRKAIRQGVPSIAECGGFLYLHDEVKDPGGESFRLCGVIHAAAAKQSHLVRFGYIELHNGQPGSFLPEGTVIRGHEFHYYDSTDNGSDIIAVKPVSGRSFGCVHADDRHWWGFPHLYYGSNPGFCDHFLIACREYRETSA